MFRRTVTLAAALCLIAAGCDKKSTPAPIGKPPPSADPVSLEDADAYVELITVALNDCNQKKMAKHIDVDAMIRRAAAASQASGRVEKQIIAGAKQAAPQFFKQLCSGVNEGSRYRAIDRRQRKQETSVVFRVTTDNMEDGVNYHEHFIGRSKRDGRVRAYDIYIYMTGQRLSDTFAELFDAMLSGDTSVNSVRAGSQRVQSAMAAGNWQRAKQELGRLDTTLRGTRPMMLADLQISSNLSDDQYSEAMERYAAKYPGDPSLELVSIDRHFLKENYTEALASIDRLDKQVGGDPYLEFMRGSVLYEQEDLAGARKRFESALEQEPEMVDAKYALVGIAMDQKDYPWAATLMNELRAQGEVFDAAVATDPFFAEFAESEPGKKFFAEL